MMKVVQDDGGRMAAGFKGNAGDCVCRAIAIAAQLPYQEVYQALAKGMADQRTTKRSGKASGVRSARNGINVKREWFKQYMGTLGFTWTPTMAVGVGCKTHLTDGELPMGRLVVSVSKHYTAVIDGVIHDTHNPQREVHCFDPEKGHSIQKRCVYGYWKLAKP